MKIVHVVLSLECGGLEKLVCDLVIKLKQRGVDAEVICLQNKGVLSEIVERAGIKVEALNKKPGIDILLIFKLAKLLKKKKARIVHTHNLGPLIYGTLAAKLLGIQVMSTRHGRTDKHVSQLIWNMNQNVVPVSHDTQEHLIKFNRISKEKLKVIYNGVDLSAFRHLDKKPLSFKKEIGLKDSSFVIGHVARLSEEKNQRTLLNVFKNLLNDGFNVELVIAGEGPLREDLESHAENIGIKENVKFLGYREDISALMSAFDVYVLPSIREGLSITILEAMASGIPVVATDVGGSPEAVVNGETGFLVKLGEEKQMQEAIEQLYHNRTLADDFGQKARKRIKQYFSIDSMALSYEQLYMKAIS